MFEKIRQWLKRASKPSSAAAESEEWDLSPDSAHPVARTLLTESFLWSTADEGAPLGSDTGADTLAAFREWRETHPKTNPRFFLSELLREWGVESSPFGELREEKLAGVLRDDHFNVLTQDDTVIALAFAQLVLEGTVEESVREQALNAIRRQALASVIHFRGWSDPAERRDRLSIMAKVLRAV